VTITGADFFVPKEVPDPWDEHRIEDVLDRDRLTALVSGPDPVELDLDVALALMDLVRDDLQLSGTSGHGRLDDAEMRLAIRALQRTTARVGQEFKFPFRDHATWRSYWIRMDASGSWQARRNLLSDLFDESYAQDRSLDASLSEAVTAHERLGWPEVDAEVGELRRHFRSAKTPQDYRAVGNDCVHITEALSRQVYDRARDTPRGEDEPPVASTKLRLDRYIERRLPGSANAQLRKLARATIELAQATKHSSTPSRIEAGIVADSVILLANMLRRLEEQ
jgi:hypothetical protein